MSRGPEPVRAKEEALQVAERRGLVQRYQHRKGNICDLSIMGPGLVTFVCAMRLIRLSSPVDDILHDYAKVIGRLRFIASSPAISRELWLRTPHGAWRFFRVLDDSVTELDRDGIPLANGTGPVNDTVPADAGLAAKLKRALRAAKKTRKDGDPAAGKVPGAAGSPATQPVPEHLPDTAPATVAGPDNPAVPANVPGAGKNPVEVSAKSDDPAVAVLPENNTSAVPALPPAGAVPADTVPAHIRRFLKWRNRAQKTDPGDG